VVAFAVDAGEVCHQIKTSLITQWMAMLLTKSMQPKNIHLMWLLHILQVKRTPRSKPRLVNFSLLRQRISTAKINQTIISRTIIRLQHKRKILFPRNSFKQIDEFRPLALKSSLKLEKIRRPKLLQNLLLRRHNTISIPYNITNKSMIARMRHIITQVILFMRNFRHHAIIIVIAILTVFQRH
jgi:hypothetical protein